MFFGTLPLDQAEGAILAHSVSVGTRRYKKGHRLAAADLALLREAGKASVIAARLESGDVPEDEAARRVAQAATGANVRRQEPFTGRCNLYASVRGVAVIDHARVDRLNAIHEAVTIATVPPFDLVDPDQMLATVKIIPFAAPAAAVAEAERIAAEGGPLVRVAGFARKRVGLAVTRLPETKRSIVDKTIEVVRTRVERCGSELAVAFDCAHEEAAVADAVRKLAAEGADPILVFGASANVDRRDVVPAGIAGAGGEVLHFGMPVDPGNLLLLARLGGRPVIGLPGCARSPKMNGFDWVLERLLADVPVTPADIARMGAGGLLKEIPTRPQPRDAEARAAKAPRAPRIAAIVLAAGRSTRMGSNKLLEPLGAKPMVAHVVDAVLGSAARPVVVVTGNQAPAVEAALAGRAVSFVLNPDFADGIAGSLRRGLLALPSGIDGAVVCLGDMPDVQAGHIDRLIAAFNPVEGRAICLPTMHGKRGNPVLFGAEFFAEMREVQGDTGARHLIGAHGDVVCEVAIDDPAVLEDIDTPEALARLRARG
ncbi:NTP transferase domain-containing protein [Desertibaculum subflavum]|uniref:NTP transferase domain-containing protein n=1 Tax=Desertibaculum subflavum TaxID=2268458 RepID=UPI000E67289E